MSDEQMTDETAERERIALLLVFCADWQRRASGVHKLASS